MRLLFVASLVFAACAYFAQGSSNKSVGIEFVAIQPCEFMMGCSTGDDACNADEKPGHRVQITKPFEMGKYDG